MSVAIATGRDIRISSSLLLCASNFTVMGRCSLTDLSAKQPLFYVGTVSGSQHDAIYQWGGSLGVERDGVPSYASLGLSGGAWFNWAIVGEGSILRCYYEGSEVATVSGAAAGRSTETMIIATNPWSDFTDGSFDGVIAFQRALSPAEITACLPYRVPQCSLTSLYGYWKFASGHLLEDSGGGSHNWTDEGGVSFASGMPGLADTPDLAVPAGFVPQGLRKQLRKKRRLRDEAKTSYRPYGR